MEDKPKGDSKKEEFEVEELDDQLEDVGGGSCTGCNSCTGCSGTGCAGCGVVKEPLNQY
ncbi:MAG: hypothetical protein QOH06_4114 [Acidobacteriota bacterium]|jgi:hypothetical protein|nr:hypothetical protein [Acidobacteriota bacterium]